MKHTFRIIRQMPAYALGLALLGAIGAPGTFAGEWTGIRAYVGDTRLAWSGESDCGPCNRFCADLRAYNRRLKELGGKGWRIGYTETGADGRPNHVCILQAMSDEPRPSFAGVTNGVEGARIEGYDPRDPAKTVDAILTLYPPGTRLVDQALAPSGSIHPTGRPRYSSLSDEEPRRAPTRVVVKTVHVPAVAGTPGGRAPRPTCVAHWTWPGDLREHLAPSHGYTRSSLDRLSFDQLKVLHDRDHDSGRVTPAGVQRWQPTGGVPHVTDSYGGIPLSGGPIAATSLRNSARNCPGGICPP